MFSETLQRSLLSEPLQPDDLQVAVRYTPASRDAQIGGDWYDSFLLRDGTLTLVVGDVAGHNRIAAAAMGQARNLLRGVAYSSGASPAGVLACLDGALAGLSTDMHATAIVAQIEHGEPPAERVTRTMHWSNAGHPPPILLAADGSTQILEAKANMLLGVDIDADRTDQTLELDCGSSVVFYTDGLIERPRAHLDTGIRWLADVLSGQQHRSTGELCDLVFGELDTDMADDVVMLVLRLSEERAPASSSTLITGPPVDVSARSSQALMGATR